jgi:hypothetical protein
VEVLLAADVSDCGALPRWELLAEEHRFEAVAVVAAEVVVVASDYGESVLVLVRPVRELREQQGLVVGVDVPRDGRLGIGIGRLGQDKRPGAGVP